MTQTDADERKLQIPQMVLPRATRAALMTARQRRAKPGATGRSASVLVCVQLRHRRLPDVA